MDPHFEGFSKNELPTNALYVKNILILTSHIHSRGSALPFVVWIVTLRELHFISK